MLENPDDDDDDVQRRAFSATRAPYTPTPPCDVRRSPQRSCSAKTPTQPTSSRRCFHAKQLSPLNAEEIAGHRARPPSTTRTPSSAPIRSNIRHTHATHRTPPRTLNQPSSTLARRAQSTSAVPRHSTRPHTRSLSPIPTTYAASGSSTPTTTATPLVYDALMYATPFPHTKTVDGRPQRQCDRLRPISSGCSIQYHSSDDNRSQDTASSRRCLSRSERLHQREDAFIKLNHHHTPITITEVQSFHDFLISGDVKAAAVRGDVEARRSARLAHDRYRSRSSILRSASSAATTANNSRAHTPRLTPLREPTPSTSQTPLITRRRRSNFTPTPPESVRCASSSTTSTQGRARIVLPDVNPRMEDDPPRKRISSRSRLVSPLPLPTREAPPHSPSNSTNSSTRSHSRSSSRAVISCQRIDDYVHLHNNNMPTDAAGVHGLHFFIDNGDAVVLEEQHHVSPRHVHASTQRHRSHHPQRSVDVSPPPPLPPST